MVVSKKDPFIDINRIC